MASFFKALRKDKRADEKSLKAGGVKEKHMKGKSPQAKESNANEQAGLSPVSFTKDYADKQMKRRRAVQEKSALPSSKRRRLILKQERAITQAASETLEGQSYESGIALETQPDVTELPVAVPHGSFKPVVIDSQQQQPTFIMFDLETTDLIRGNMMPHITQVAAVEPRSNTQFNIYVKPKVPVSSEAQRITGIVVSDSGNMSVHGEAVQFTSITAAANAFNAWVSRFQNVVLVAHCGRGFDFPVYVSMLESIGALEVFCDKVIGFIDSLEVFKKVFPNEKSYKQEELVRRFLQKSYSAHDAMEDVLSLGHLILHSNCSSEFLLKHSFSPKAVYNQRLFNRE